MSPVKLPPARKNTMLHAQTPLPDPGAPAPDLAGAVGGFLDLIPAPVLFLAAIVTAVAVLGALARRRPGPKDPTRIFSANQRREGFDRAGGRCELGGMFRRCSRPAHHGDHWYPWSRGGSSSMANFVAACVKCNLSKGARVPGAWETMRLEARRRKYFPAGLSPKAGERFTQR